MGKTTDYPFSPRKVNKNVDVVIHAISCQKQRIVPIVTVVITRLQ